jgi:hypothetical protein
MKKLFVSLFAFIVMHGAANAQFTKGSTFLGGSFNFATQKEGGSTTSSFSSSSSSTSINLTPEFSYMLNNNTALGVGLSFSNVYQKSSSDTKYKTNIISPSLFIQNYYPLAQKLYLSLKSEVGFGWVTNKSEYTSYTNKSEYNVVGCSISPELDYFITSKVGMKANFNGFSFAHYYNDEDYYFNKVQFDLNPSNWSFGFFVKL